MCGISGVFNFAANGEVEPSWLARMNELQQHRGPDEEGVFINGQIGLANRRLAITDRMHGHQPMSTEDGTVWITYNGEVFEYLSLRRELERSGYRFRTRSDTEVVLYAYRAYGEACVHRLDGQFAFAIWDCKKNTLFLARDRLGIAPLHYAIRQGQFIFASEAKAILALPAIEASADPEAVVEVLLCGTLFGGRTMFTDIKSLEPGFTLTVSATGCRLRRYWDIPRAAPDLTAPSQEYYMERLVPLLVESLRIRVPTEVEWGLMLSGGTDSSTLCMLASRQTSTALRTFTIDFPNRWKGEDVDAYYAGQLASDLGTRHRVFMMCSENYYATLERLVWHLERPFNKGAASMYLLYEQVRAYVKVILTGEGADEIFAGYVGSRGLGLDEVLATGRLQSFPWAPHWDVMCRLFSSEFSALMQPREIFAERLANSLAHSETADKLNQTLYLYCKYFLLDLLEIHDRCAMAFGVEGRMPFLDHRFVEVFSPMPSHLKLKDGQTKYLLKQAIRDIIPEAIVKRKKTHMPIPRDPQSVFAQIERARDLLFDPQARTARYYDLSRMRIFLERREDFAAIDMVIMWQLTLYLITLELHHRVFRL